MSTSTPPDDDHQDHAHAKAMALEWAEQADGHQLSAHASHDKAAQHKGADGQWVRQLIAEHQADAAHHTERATVAVRMAEMWAKVAACLEPRPDPALAEAAWRAQAEVQAGLSRAMAEAEQ